MRCSCRSTTSPSRRSPRTSRSCSPRSSLRRPRSRARSRSKRARARARAVEQSSASPAAPRPSPSRPRTARTLEREISRAYRGHTKCFGSSHGTTTMPANDDAMNDPITRREFHERLTRFGAELRTGLRGEMAQLRTELRADMVHLRVTLQADAQATLKALNEENRAWFLTIDDKYKDLPDRVRILEEAVFSPPPRTRRRKAS